MRVLLLVAVVLVLGLAGRADRDNAELEAQQTREIMILAQQWAVRE